MAHKFEIYKDKAGEFRFRYKASNGEIMFSSEGYKAKTSALDAIESIKKNVAGASVDDHGVVPQGGSDLRGRAVREGQEDHVVARQVLRGGVDQYAVREVAQMGLVHPKRVAHARVGREGAEPDVRVRGEHAQDLAPDVP